MNNFDFDSFMQNLAANGIEASTAALIATGIFILLLVMAYLIRKALSDKKTQPMARAAEVPRPTPKPAPAQTRTAQPAPPPAPKPAMSEAPQPAPAPIQTRAPAAATAPAPRAATKAPTAPAHGAHVPRDSILQRHYLTHVAHMLETVACPRPTDSVLKRHHEHLLQSRLRACLRDKACLDKLVSDYEACRAVRASEVNQTPVAESPAPVSIATPAPVARSTPEPSAEVTPPPVRIPEDSILRRHFLSHLAHMLESVAAPRPTDSVLKRHHEHWLMSECAACLRDPARMARLVSEYEACRVARV